jgi:hypothetical protein
MDLTRRLATVALTAVTGLALAAGPAAAKAKDFTFFADIDCGDGVVQVGSGDDLWSALVDLDSGKKYKPVAWHVTFPGGSLDENKKGEPKKHAVECSYTDGVATGTVIVKKA